MTNNTPRPNGQPWEQHPGGQHPGGKAEAKAARPWYKKKRVIIPAGVLALLIGIGSCGGGGEDPSSDQSGQVQETTAAAEPTADAAAEASAEAAEKAEAEAEARAKEEAEAEAAKKAEEEAAAKQAEEEAAAKAEAEAKAAEGTLSQQNALRSAQNYLDFQAFSRSGLIKQLEFEEYSTEDATWAVDRVEVDWNEQAAKSAQNYLDFQAFSRQGLIDQLIFEGFTAKQAEYGVSQTGL
jgi:colicin import membrane protein